MADSSGEENPRPDEDPESRLAGHEEDDSFPVSAEILERMPPQGRERVTRSFAAIVRFSGPDFNPVSRRLTSEHITQALNNAADQNRQEAEAERSNRRYKFLYFALALIAVVFVLVFFSIREQYDVLVPIATAIMGFAAGVGVSQTAGRR